MKTISSNELRQFCRGITDTCFIKIESNEKTGILFYKAGKIINASINDKYKIKYADEILTWENVVINKTKIDSTVKFDSESLKYIFDLIEFVGISADIYIKHNKNILVLCFSEGCLVTIIPEVSVTKDFLKDILDIKAKSFKMKLTGERTGELKIFVSELLDV